MKKRLKVKKPEKIWKNQNFSGFAALNIHVKRKYI